MNDRMSNIEAVARDICSKQMSEAGMGTAELSTYVNRYWHCVAAELESGQIDEAGNRLFDFNLDKGLEAFRDWRQRHPDPIPRI